MIPASELEKMFGALAGGTDGAARAEALATVDDAAALAEYLKFERQTFMERILAPGATAGAAGPPGGLQMSREFSDLTDAVIRRMYVLACRRSGARFVTR